MPEKTKLHINQLKERNHLENLLIASGAVFRLISSQILSLSDVEIAMELEMSVPLVRRAIATLEQDQLVVQNYQGDWQCVAVFAARFESVAFSVTKDLSACSFPLHSRPYESSHSKAAAAMPPQ